MISKRYIRLIKLFSIFFILILFISSQLLSDKITPPIDFSQWKITFPVKSKKGNAMEILNPTFNAWQENNDIIPENLKEYFYKNGDNWVFYTPYTGITTSSKAKYSRTELREMNDAQHMSWPLSIGGILEGRLKVYDLQNKAKKIIFMQIHGHSPNSKPLLKCIWEKGKIRMLTKKGVKSKRRIKLKDFQGKKSYGKVKENTWFTFKIEANSAAIKMFLNGSLIEEYGSDVLDSWPENNTYYFKAGNYLQSTKKGSSAKVEFSRLRLSH